MDDRHARHRRADADRRRRPSDGHRSRDRARFQRLVADAVAGLPPTLRSQLDRVELVIHDVPPRGATAVLSRYEPAAGDPSDTAGADQLTLFRRPLELRAASKLDLIDLVRETLVHELAHHLGIDDDGIDELGW
jgi:predicted Zn-dependent protease with MMP-like domain